MLLFNKAHIVLSKPCELSAADSNARQYGSTLRDGVVSREQRLCHPRASDSWLSDNKCYHGLLTHLMPIVDIKVIM